MAAAFWQVFPASESRAVMIRESAMRQKKLSVKMMNRISIVVTVVVILAGVYIMANQLGLVDSLDFGAGAYYYADMPGFEKLVNGNHYQSPVSMGTLISVQDGKIVQIDKNEKFRFS